MLVSQRAGAEKAHSCRASTETRVRTEAIVLAAGAGARFGGGKLLAPWGGSILLSGALSAALASQARVVHVVWGADPAVATAARRIAEQMGQGARLRLVAAARHAEGLSASLAAGVIALPDDVEAAFVFLGDMPRIAAGVPGALTTALTAGALAAAPTFDGRRGHPVLFRRGLFSRLATLSGDRGAADLLRELGDRLTLVASPDDGVLFDVDSPSDLFAAS
jgi:molybdenum cofactor cytidylyltransferase